MITTFLGNRNTRASRETRSVPFVFVHILLY
nr:MAG TPA: hypothetical protein [Bacteriophage sp.]